MTGTRQLAADLEIGRLGFGAMQLPGPGVWGPPADPAGALAVLRRAVELGVTFVDTADFYGPYVANVLIQEALWPYPDDLVIATKVGAVRDEGRGFAPAAAPAQLRAQVQDNLDRLGVPALDLVYLRVGGDGLLPVGDTPFADSYAALAELRERGLIRHLGLSGVSPEQLAVAGDIAPVAAVQNRFHLFDRGSRDVLELCERRGVVFVPYFPLAAGLLRPGLDKALLPPGMAPTDAQEATLDAVAARHDATRAQVALAWLLCRWSVTVVIPGTRSIAHLEENMRAADLRLTPVDLLELDGMVLV